MIVGTKTWMKDMKVIGLTEDVYRAANQLESQAKTAVFVAIDLEVCWRAPAVYWKLLAADASLLR